MIDGGTRSSTCACTPFTASSGQMGQLPTGEVPRWRDCGLRSMQASKPLRAQWSLLSAVHTRWIVRQGVRGWRSSSQPRTSPSSQEQWWPVVCEKDRPAEDSCSYCGGSWVRLPFALLAKEVARCVWPSDLLWRLLQLGRQSGEPRWTTEEFASCESVLDWVFTEIRFSDATSTPSQYQETEIPE